MAEQLRAYAGACDDLGWAVASMTEQGAVLDGLRLVGYKVRAAIAGRTFKRTIGSECKGSLPNVPNSNKMCVGGQLLLAHVFVSCSIPSHKSTGVTPPC